MELNTHLAVCIDSTEYESQYDIQAKNLAADKQILAKIIKDTVDELKDYNIETIITCIEGTPQISVVPIVPKTKKEKRESDENIQNEKNGRKIKTRTEEKITGLNTESVIINEGTVRYDIRCYVLVPKSQERVKIFLNLELQKDYQMKYDLVTRGIFNCARMISEQKDTEFSNDNYQDIKKVYSIWVCMNVPKKAANTISGYTMTREDVYGEYDKEEYYDLLTVVMIRLPEEEKEEAGNDLINMLTILYSHKLSANEKKKKLKEKYGLCMTREVEGGIENMCNLSQGVKAAGIQQGMQQGKHMLSMEILLDALSALGEIPENLCSIIRKEESIETYKKWIATAYKSSSIEQFMLNMNL